MAGAALLAHIWSRFKLSEVVGTFTQVGWLGIPLIGLSCVWLPFDCLAFSRLLRPGAFGSRLLLLEWAADGLSGLLPVGGFGGDPFRYRHSAPLSDAPGRVVVANRLLHAWSGLLAAVAAGAACWVLRLPGLQWGYLTGVGTTVFLVGAAAMLLTARKQWPQMPLARLGQAMGFKMVSRLIQAAELWVLLSALGYPVSPGQTILIHAHLVAVASIFVFVPGGLGVQENALMLGTAAAGLPPLAGLQVGLLRRLRQVLWSMTGLGAGAYLEASLRSPKSSSSSS